MSCPKGRDMGCLLWVYVLNHSLAFSLSHCVQYRVIFDRDILRVWSILLRLGNDGFPHFLQSYAPTAQSEFITWTKTKHSTTSIIFHENEWPHSVSVCFISETRRGLRARKSESSQAFNTQSKRLFQYMGNIFCVEFPYTMSYPYIERCVGYWYVKFYELLDLRARKCFGNVPLVTSLAYSRMSHTRMISIVRTRMVSQLRWLHLHSPGGHCWH